MTRKEFLERGAFDLFAMVRDAVRDASPVEPTKSVRAAVPLRIRPLPLRPPGAVPEADFLARCTRCDACISACPHWVIRKAGPELGTRLAGTPVIVPLDNPCLMCADFPCAAACESGALERPTGRARIGLAVIDRERCFSARGQPCDYCSVHCPVRPRAIERVERGTAPFVDPGRCTGCGACAQLCPARAIGLDDVRGGTA